MNNYNRSKPALAAVLLALSVFSVPQIAHAGKEDRARAAAAEARGKVEAAAQAGATENAGAILGQARAAVAEADRLIKKKDNEDASWHKSQEATALAELAIATAELQKLQQQRDQLRAGQ